MLKAKIAVMVSGGGTNLQALIDAEKSGIIKNGEIALVISNNKDAYALTRAEKSGIKTEVVLKKDFSTQLEFEEKIKEILTENEIDFIIEENGILYPIEIKKSAKPTKKMARLIRRTGLLNISEFKKKEPNQKIWFFFED